jgi:peptidyl-prolyl cis-trans isomerase SurA
MSVSAFSPVRRLARLLALASLAAGLSVAVPAAEKPATDTLDRIVAVVNDDVITFGELRDRLQVARRQIVLEKITPPPDEVLQKQILERLILERLQLQLADKSGLQVSEADVDRAIEGIAGRNKMTVTALRERMKKEGIDPAAHRAQVRTQMLIDQLVDREVRSRVTVTDGEIDGFLAGLSQEMEYRLSHIFLSLPENATPTVIEAARQRAAELVARLRGGGDFQQLAVAHSQAPDALQGGHLGWKKPGQLPDLFVNTLKAMNPGEISDALRSPNGFHILRLHERRGGPALRPVQQTRVRHILLRTSEILSAGEARQRLLALRGRIEHGEDFAALARAHSEDPGSAARGGELGWVSPGQLVPEFERTMDALKPGELSQPVQSSFGLHLIQVQERREQGASAERLRNAARAQLHSRKADERYRQWVRQLRDESYVEVHLETP